MSQPLENINVLAQELLMSPAALKQELPCAEDTHQFLGESRKVVEQILAREDPRLLVVVGPCSIHDPSAALEYAKKLKELSKRVQRSLFLVMRAYFEKPRTTTGWKGLVNDPHLDDSFEIGEGIRIARKLLLEISKMGVPLSTEALDPISPQYLQDLIVWSAIGARTTESQTHREMASGLSSAVGFKNGTDGSLEVAINALKSVSQPHRFLGINPNGQVSVVHTRGNRLAHIVLRGGNSGPNYHWEQVAACETAMKDAGITPNIMIDCSHANSNKDYRNQKTVLADLLTQIQQGNRSIMGIMLESNLFPGNQSLSGDPKALKYGVSITDACIGWTETEDLLINLDERLCLIQGRHQ